MLQKKLVLLIAIIFISQFSFTQNGSLKGKVVDKYSKEPIPFVNIILEKDGKEAGGVNSDFEGNYIFRSLEPGTYDVNAAFVGYTSIKITSVVISSNEIKTLDIEIKPSTEMLEVVEIIDYRMPLIHSDQTASGNTVSANSINKMPSPGNTKRQASKNESFIVNDSDYQYRPGQITATEINDFSKWELWNDISLSDLKKFQTLWRIFTDSRYSIQVILENDVPLVDAKVYLKNNDNVVLWVAKTDNTGKAELWAGLFKYQSDKKLKIIVEHDEMEYEYNKPNVFQKGINILKIPGTCSSPENIDIAFVVDATGSMDDEIDFLKTDLVNIVQDVKSDIKGSIINTGSVFYRCEGNSYVTKIAPLTSDISSSIGFIRNQFADEGGDEVVEKALCLAIDSLQWSASARSRILFLILDQQPLTSDRVINIMHRNIEHAASKGIRIVPIVASAETMYNAYSLEYLMRSLALATNGTSVFLTNHSNIGGLHATPTTDEYDVELLNNLVKRIIYQFSTIVPCDGKIMYDTTEDTVLITNSPILFHEIVDSSRITEVENPKIKLKDLTHSNHEDTLVSEEISETSIEVEAPEIKVVSISCYPNPTTGIINLDITGVINEIYLSDATGKLISRYNTKYKKLLKIDLSNYGTGIYFVSFVDNNKRYIGKIILTR